MITSQLFLAVKALFTQGHVTKNDVGLGNVDNTSDADKPVSDATQQALNAVASGIPTREQIQDIVGEMLTGGSYTGITPTYSDNAEGDGFIDLDTTPPVTLNALSLSANTYTTNAISGTVIGAIQGKTTGSTLTLNPNDGKFAIDGSNNLIVGVSPDTVAGAKNFSIIESLTGATNTPNPNALSVTAQAPVSIQTTAVTQYNKVMRAAETRSGTNAKVDTWTGVIGTAPTDVIGCQITNGFFPSNGVFEPLTARTYEVWIWYNGVCVKCSFGGNGVYSATAGEADITSDLIPAADFGVSEIPVGATIGYKCRQVFNTGDTVGFNARDARSSSDHQSVFYDTATTTIGNLDGVGKFTLTGGTPQARNNGFQPFIIGKFKTANQPVFLATGDSNTDGVGDNTEISTPTGAGWFQKLTANFYNNAPTASMNLAVSGATSIHALTPEMQTYFKYATEAVTAFGTNDLGSSGTGDLQLLYDRTNLIVTAMKSEGINNVHGSQLPPRATSTDLWLTPENQTARSGWVGPTASGNLFNANVGTETTVNSVIPLQSVRDPNNGDIFKTDGVTERYTAFDDTHLSANGNSLRAAEAKTHLTAFYNW